MEAACIADLVGSLRQIAWHLTGVEVEAFGSTQHLRSAIRLSRSLEMLREACVALHLTATVVPVDRAIRNLRALPTLVQGELQVIDQENVRSDINHLLVALKDECESRRYWQLSLLDHELYTNTHPFGEAVLFAFPNAANDIEEAAKCLALHRGTACVMHCMRVVELGARAIARSLGSDEFQHSSWRVLIKTIGRYASQPDSRIAAGTLNEITMYISQIGVASRNPTMHAARSYTVDQARDMFNVTKSFMTYLAGVIPEDIGVA